MGRPTLSKGIDEIIEQWRGERTKRKSYDLKCNTDRMEKIIPLKPLSILCIIQTTYILDSLTCAHSGHAQQSTHTKTHQHVPWPHPPLSDCLAFPHLLLIQSGLACLQTLTALLRFVWIIIGLFDAGTVVQSLIIGMGSCVCAAGARQPRKKRSGPYLKVNAYTQEWSCEQVLTFGIVTAQLGAHSVFVVPAVAAIGNSVLWIMLGYFYVALVLVVYDYLVVTRSDPVDPLLEQEELANGFSLGELKFCLLCDCQVQLSSHHCMRCNRCTLDFDHHCRFLNNCIGSRNYEPFFRLLLTYASFAADAIAMASWTAVRAFREPSLSFNGGAYGMVALAGVSLLALCAVVWLMGFHCYITCCEGTTTFNHNHAASEPPNSERVNINVKPASSKRLSLENRFS